jgi:hypothetical protein
MKWLEEIQVRFLRNDYEHLRGEFEQLKQKLKKENKIELTLYSKAGLNSDIKLYLTHHSEKVETEGSALGLHIKAELENYGIVNHSVWIKAKENKKDMERK